MGIQLGTAAMITEIPVEQLRKTIESIAMDVLARAQWQRPPVDALAVAKRLDLVIARDRVLDVRARFVRLGEAGRTGRGTIFLGDDPRPERRQWAVAHEIGESVAHRVFAQLGTDVVDIPTAERERVANQLANCLLLPRAWLAADGDCFGWDLFELKQIYRTASHELIARRMLEMTPPVVVTLFDQGAMQWRRSNLGNRPPSLSSAEASVWRTAFETGRPTEFDHLELPEGIRQIRCWPVHEPGWRREIMRTELEEW